MNTFATRRFGALRQSRATAEAWGMLGLAESVGVELLELGDEPS